MLPVAVALALTAGCTSGEGPAADTSTTTSAPTDEVAVTATAPSVPVGVKDCGTQNDLAGWPTTMLSSPDAYACIVDALAAGTPAQMSSITATDGTSGRTTDDGYDIPARRIVTWFVTGQGAVEETIDRTEEGGDVRTRTCAAFTEAAFGVPVSATDCS